MGSVRNPCSCTGQHTFSVYSQDGSGVLDIVGGISEDSQSKRLDFYVTLVPSGEPVGNITKKAPKNNFFEADDVDNYFVEFGDDLLPEEKALVMAATLMMDYCYFNCKITMLKPAQQAMGGLVRSVRDTIVEA